MDTMEESDKFFEGILKQLFENISKSEVITSPFPHILIEDGLDDSISFKDFISECNILNTNNDNGRNQTSVVVNQNSKYLNKLEDLIVSKFKLNIPSESDMELSLDSYVVKSTSVNLWEDSSELEIQDIHLDYLIRDKSDHNLKQVNTDDTNQIVFSLHLYLPDDNDNHILGTHLWSIKDNKDGMDISNFLINSDLPLVIPTMITSNKEIKSKYLKLEKILPFKKGVVYIHPTTPNSWHSAPYVPAGYIRKSLMIRWDFTKYTKIFI